MSEKRKAAWNEGKYAKKIKGVEIKDVLNAKDPPK